MSEVLVTKTTTADPQTVWDVMTNVERWDEVISGVDKVERLDDGQGFGQGLRWRETRTMFGKEATEEMEVTSVDLDTMSYVVEAESHGTHYRSVMRVAPTDSGTTLSMTFGADPQGRMAKLAAKTMARAFAKATRKALQQDLEDIAAAAEARSADDDA